MINLYIYAGILLFVGLISTGFISFVLKRQIELFKKPIFDKNARLFRRKLLKIALAIFIVNLIPAFIDVLTFFIDVGRPMEVNLVSFLYTGSLHIVALLLSIWFYQIYKLAEDSNDEDR